MKQVLVGTLSVWHINGIIYIYIYIYILNFLSPKAMAKFWELKKKHLDSPQEKHDITICVDVSAYFSTARWAVAISDL